MTLNIFYRRGTIFFGLLAILTFIIANSLKFTSGSCLDGSLGFSGCILFGFDASPLVNMLFWSLLATVPGFSVFLILWALTALINTIKNYKT